MFPLFCLSWRERLIDALVAAVIVPNHTVRIGRQLVLLKDLRHEQIKAIADTPLMHSEAGADLRLLIAIGSLWGATALARVRFGADVNPRGESSRLGALLSGLRQ